MDTPEPSHQRSVNLVPKLELCQQTSGRVEPSRFLTVSMYSTSDEPLPRDGAELGAGHVLDHETDNFEPTGLRPRSRLRSCSSLVRSRWLVLRRPVSVFTF